MGFTIYHGLLAGISLLIGSSILTQTFARRRRLAGWLNFAFCLAAACLLVGISVQVLTGGAPGGEYHIGVGAFQIPFLIDGFSALFIVLISVMAVITAFYCVGYMEMDHYRTMSLRGFFVAYPIFIAGMIGIVTVDDFSTGFTIAWQMMTLASFFLIRFDHNDRAIVRSANKFLVLMQLAWLSVVAGALLIPGSSLGTPLHALTDGLGGADMLRRSVVYGLLMFGFAMKAGMFPLGQLWLPDAYSAAPSPISALLSGVMAKTGVFGIVRTLFWMVPAAAQEQEGRYLGLILASFGVVTLFIGTVRALKQQDAKRLHAYSSMGQMGYSLLGLGTAQYFLLSDSPMLMALAGLALMGAIYHALNHAVFKGLLFLSTGSVRYATGTSDLDKLGGLVRVMPITALAAAVGTAAVVSIPAFSGFMSKWSIISSALLGGREGGVLVLFGVIALMTSAVTLATYVKFYGMTFTSSGIESTPRVETREVGAMMLLPKLVLAGICLIQGLFPVFFIGVITQAFVISDGSTVQSLFSTLAAENVLASNHAGTSFSLSGAPVAYAMPLVLLGMFAVAYLFALWLRHAGGSSERTAPVWLGGYQLANNANRYSSNHIYAAFTKLMKWTGGNVR
jgi:hydrogenase-4 component B